MNPWRIYSVINQNVVTNFPHTENEKICDQTIEIINSPNVPFELLVRYIMQSAYTVRWNSDIYANGKTKVMNDNKINLKVKNSFSLKETYEFDSLISFGVGKLRLSIIFTNVSISFDNLGLNFFSSATVVSICPLKV